MIDIQKLDKKSLFAQRYKEKMYIIKVLHDLEYPFETNDDDLAKLGLAHYKCAMCRNCIMKSYHEDGYYMYCKIKKKDAILLKPEKVLECKWLNFRYSDLRPALKNHNITLDEILRRYKE